MQIDRVFIVKAMRRCVFAFYPQMRAKSRLPCIWRVDLWNLIAALCVQCLQKLRFRKRQTRRLRRSKALICSGLAPGLDNLKAHRRTPILRSRTFAWKHIWRKYASDEKSARSQRAHWLDHLFGACSRSVYSEAHRRTQSFCSPTFAWNPQMWIRWKKHKMKNEFTGSISCSRLASSVYMQRTTAAQSLCSRTFEWNKKMCIRGKMRTAKADSLVRSSSILAKIGSSIVSPSRQSWYLRMRFPKFARSMKPEYSIHQSQVITKVRLTWFCKLLFFRSWMNSNSTFWQVIRWSNSRRFRWFFDWSEDFEFSSYCLSDIEIAQKSYFMKHLASQSVFFRSFAAADFIINVEYTRTVCQKRRQQKRKLTNIFNFS